MNIYALSIGLLISIYIIKQFKFHQYRNTQIAYVAYFTSLQAYYGLFAFFTGDLSLLSKEIIIGLVFITVAGISLALNRESFSLILGSAYLLHALYDVYHAQLFFNAGIPDWWPEFSGVINIVLGGYIISLNMGQWHKLSACHIPGARI